MHYGADTRGATGGEPDDDIFRFLAADVPGIYSAAAPVDKGELTSDFINNIAKIDMYLDNPLVSETQQVQEQFTRKEAQKRASEHEVARLQARLKKEQNRLAALKADCSDTARQRALTSREAKIGHTTERKKRKRAKLIEEFEAVCALKRWNEPLDGGALDKEWLAQKVQLAKAALR